MRKCKMLTAVVVIPREQFDRWLNPESDANATFALLKPAPDDFFERVAVSKVFNKVSATGPECLAPAA